MRYILVLVLLFLGGCDKHISPEQRSVIYHTPAGVIICTQEPYRKVVKVKEEAVQAASAAMKLAKIAAIAKQEARAETLATLDEKAKLEALVREKTHEVLTTTDILAKNYPKHADAMRELVKDLFAREDFNARILAEVRPGVEAMFPDGPSLAVLPSFDEVASRCEQFLDSATAKSSSLNQD